MSHAFLPYITCFLQSIPVTTLTLIVILILTYIQPILSYITCFPERIPVTTITLTLILFSSSVCASYISGVHHLGWAFFACVFNQTIEAVTFRLHGWCMLGVFFVAGIHCLGHECQDLLSLTSVYTLIRKSFGGMESENGKIPSTTKISRRGVLNPHRCIKQDSEPITLPMRYLGLTNPSLHSTHFCHITHAFLKVWYKHNKTSSNDLQIKLKVTANKSKPMMGWSVWPLTPGVTFVTLCISQCGKLPQACWGWLSTSPKQSEH